MDPQAHPKSHAVPMALIASVLLAGFLAMALPAAATHETVPWSYPISAASSGNEEMAPTVLADGAGNLYVFYVSFNPLSGSTDLFVTKFATRGAFGAPQQILSPTRVNNLPGAVAPVTPFGIPPTPSAGLDSSGNVYVAWTSLGNDIFVSKSADGGFTWSVAVQVSLTNPSFVDVLPTLVVDPSDTIWVAWIKWVTPGDTDWEVTVARSTDAGVTYSGHTNAASGEPGTPSFFSSDLAVDSGGRLYAAYTKIEPGFACPCRANWTWSDDGATWSAPRSFSAGPDWTLAPAVEVDASDRVHAAWLNFVAGPAGGLTHSYRHSTDRGATWSVEVLVGQGTAGPFSFDSDLAVSGDTVLAAWDGIRGPLVGLSYAVSGDAGIVWAPEAFHYPGRDVQNPRLDVDENGTVWAVATDTGGPSLNVLLLFWDTPPSRPRITSVVRGTDNLTVSWTAAPEGDLAYYQVWRSLDGSSYEVLATVPAGTTAYVDGGLANGTYWYRVTSVDGRATSSHASAPMAGTVGPTIEERFAQLDGEILALQNAVALAQADLDALQAALASFENDTMANFSALQNAIGLAQADLDTLQGELASFRNGTEANLTAVQNALATALADLSALQAQLAAFESATGTDLTDLQNQLTALQGQLTDLSGQLSTVQTEQATQTMSFVNLGFEILVLVLLLLVLLNVIRRPKMPVPAPAPTPAPEAPPAPPKEEL